MRRRLNRGKQKLSNYQYVRKIVSYNPAKFTKQK